MRSIVAILLICLVSLQLINCKRETSYHDVVVLKGKVRDSFSNKPVKELKISILKEVGMALSYREEWVQDVPANADGTFEIRYYPDARANYRLRFSSTLKLANVPTDFWGGSLSLIYPLTKQVKFDSYSQESFTFDEKLDPSGLVEFTEELSNPEYGIHIRGVDVPFTGGLGFLPLSDSITGMYYPTTINKLFRYDVLIVHNLDTLKVFRDSVFCIPYERNTQLIKF